MWPLPSLFLFERTGTLFVVFQYPLRIVNKTPDNEHHPAILTVSSTDRRPHDSVFVPSRQMPGGWTRGNRLGFPPPTLTATCFYPSQTGLLCTPMGVHRPASTVTTVSTPRPQAEDTQGLGNCEPEGNYHQKHAKSSKCQPPEEIAYVSPRDEKNAPRESALSRSETGPDDNGRERAQKSERGDVLKPGEKGGSVPHFRGEKLRGDKKTAEDKRCSKCHQHPSCCMDTVRRSRNDARPQQHDKSADDGEETTK